MIDVATGVPSCPIPMMSSHFRVLLCSAFFVATGWPMGGAAEAADAWTLAAHNDDVTVYTRPHEGSSIRECKAVGLIDAEPIVVRRVLDDTAEYPKFMPYVVETRTISHSAEGHVGYQRISPPIIGDRDYTVRVKYESRPCPTGGTIYCNRWEAANDLGPAEIKGVTRVKITQGSWLLEPALGGKTRATYTIYSDSGGSLPTFILNAANRTAIPKLFEAVRKQAKLEKYQSK
jgi:hypothetical protein